MIDHTGIAVKDFDASKKFYDAALAPLGASLIMMVPLEYTGGIRVGGYGYDRPQFWLHESGEPGPGRHYAFTADKRSEVDAFYAAAMAAGGRDNGKPGIRAHYHPNYYGAFVFDPDGNNIEAVCHQPE
ncbi:MAG: glyoxalase/bleomycin resistance/extradiol dioxygenase family protein [Proteobacteria bacterium]|jgi:catechol 2,3-dioxygenase-like lactoylglutathione lyase family enzyme|nr:MAG: glyoxalase/bleomycin resistance/extradiol dioxygenase family protein [Pseudomonadota bacterium]